MNNDNGFPAINEPWKLDGGREDGEGGVGLGDTLNLINIPFV